MIHIKDNSIAPIIAFDFDGTIDHINSYPSMGKIRPYTAEVMQFLHDIGTKIIIWTCRNDEDAINNYLSEHNIKIDAINTSIEFAPYSYESRKIYAHMYVDDRGFGWHDGDTVMVDILIAFIRLITNVHIDIIQSIRGEILYGRDKIQYARCVNECRMHIKNTWHMEDVGVYDE